MEGIAKTARAIDSVNEVIGKITSWAALGLVLVQFGIVMMNFLYSEGVIAVQESLTYMHSLLFLGAAGYTLLHNGHVRVDIFYSKMPERKKSVYQSDWFACNPFPCTNFHWDICLAVCSPIMVHS